jgi:hypothetical protein
MRRSLRLAFGLVAPLMFAACSPKADDGGPGDGGKGGAGGQMPGTGGATGGGTGGMTAGRIDPAASAQDSAQRTADIVKQLGAAISFESADGTVLSKLLGTFFGGGSSSTRPHLAIPAPLPRPLADLLLHTPARKTLRRAPLDLSLTTQEENFDDTATDLGALVKDRLLAAGNIESKTDTSVTYLLHGDPTCRPLPSAIGDGKPDRVDPGCAADLEKLQVRIVVSADGDGYRFAVQLGPDRLELSVFVIHTDLVAWQMDLDMAHKATDFANHALMKASDPFPFAALSGRIQLAVHKLGDKKASFAVSVLTPVDLKGTTSDPFELSMAAADPWFAVTGDGTTKEVTLELAAARTDVRAPWDPRNTGVKNTDLHVQIGGLFGKTKVSEASQKVALTGFGVGPSFVEVRGSHIVDVAFNPASGNKMDLELRSLPGDETHIEITPRFDLSLGFAFEAIASELSAKPPSFLLGETYSVVLSGGTPIVVETVKDDGMGFAGGLKMVAGSLVLSTTSSAAATVSVGAGQCLTSAKMPPAGAHPLLGSLTAATCP